MLARSLGALALILVANPAAANDLLGRPEYAPSGLTRAVGYHDHAGKDGTWVIEAMSSRRERSGYASDMALYRAAEVTGQQGHRFFQLLRSEGSIGTGTINWGAENVSLIVRFADSAAPPTDCLQRGKHPGECYTVEAAKVLQRLEPRVRNASWRLDSASQLEGAQSISDHSGLLRFATLFRFDLTEHGKVENCSLVQTDAPADFNATACQIFAKMARLKVGRDNAGDPVRSTRTARVIWQRSDLGGVTTMVSLPDEPASGGMAVAVSVVSPAPRTEAPAPAQPAVPGFAQGAFSPNKSAVSPPGRTSAKPVSSSASRAAAQDDTVLVPFDPA